MFNNQAFDIAVGVVGLLTVPLVVWGLIYSQLPCTHLRELQTTFSETEALLDKNAEAGLLGSHETALDFRRRLDLLRERIEIVQVESHCATTYLQNFTKMLTGLSRRIYSLCVQVKKLRAEISTTSARERERLRQAQATTTLEAHAEGTNAPSSSPSCSSTAEDSGWSSTPTISLAPSSSTPSEHSPTRGLAKGTHATEACVTEATEPTLPPSPEPNIVWNPDSIAADAAQELIATETPPPTKLIPAHADEQIDTSFEPSTKEDMPDPNITSLHPPPQAGPSQHVQHARVYTAGHTGPVALVHEFYS